MRVVTIDFETYWSSKDNYTLTKMGPIEYIRDERFAPQCFSFRVDHGPTMCVECVDNKDIEVLKALGLDRADTVTVGHNINGFDGMVLSDHYGIKPAFIVDTISIMHWLGLSRVMSCSHKSLTNALGNGIKRPGTVISDGKVAIKDFTPEEWDDFKKYCCEDTYQCSENFFAMIKHVTNTDALQLINLTAKMATEPSFIPNGAMLKDYLSHLDNTTDTAMSELGKMLGYATADDMLKAIRSRKTFPSLLESLGVQCPMKLSAKQGIMVPAISKTDLDFVALKHHDDKRVAKLVTARLEHNSSIQRSRTDSLLTFADRPLPILLSALKAHTGRYTAGNEGTSDGLNFQNLSKRDPSKLTLRKAIQAPTGYKVVACDSSQIEARILAWVAGQTDLVEQFKDGRDPYAEMASKIFNVPAKDIHDAAKIGSHPMHDTYKTYRNVGKTCILSAGYGVSAQKFSDTLLRSGVKLSDNLAEHAKIATHAHSIYRATNYAIVNFWKVTDNVIRELAMNTALGDYATFGAHNEFCFGRATIPCTGIVSPFIRLPNGYNLWYPNLRFTVNQDTGLTSMCYDRIEHGKAVPKNIYGAGGVENVCQSYAFMMLGWQACRMTEMGIPLKANIHDAWITVVPSNKAEQVKSLMEQAMASVPDWLCGFPVACEAEIGDDFRIA
jgi:DNA polymerase